MTFSKHIAVINANFVNYYVHVFVDYYVINKAKYLANAFIIHENYFNEQLYFFLKLCYEKFLLAYFFFIIIILIINYLIIIIIVKINFIMKLIKLFYFQYDSNLNYFQYFLIIITFLMNYFIKFLFQ